MNSNFSNDIVVWPLKYHQELDLTISDITNLGLGVGRLNNWVVMVPFVCIGEKVRARIFRNHKNYSEADLLEVLEPAKERITPKCPLFGICGGCQYQHITYQEQLHLKCKQVKELLLRIGKVDVKVNECLYSSYEYGYRSKITPHFQKFREGESFNIGFLAYGCKRKIIDVKQCIIATNAINRALPAVREKIILEANKKKRGGTILLRDVNGEVVSDSNAKVKHSVNGINFQFQAGAFFQNNTYLLPKMIEYVVNASLGEKFLIDAYCGVGIFGICASKYFERVCGIETDEHAIMLASENARINSINNIDFISGDAADIFRNISFYSEDTCILIDPPRAGCSKNFLDQLLYFLPKKIIYISCAPDTQARDVFSLKDWYSVLEVQPVDMFPQTRHIENIITLIKK